MSAQTLQPALIATLALLGVLVAGPARGADPLPAKSLLGRAQSSAERESLESLLSKLEAERKPAPPRQLDEAAKAEELARQLEQAPAPPAKADAPVIPPAAPTGMAGASTKAANSFSFPKSMGGQPIGRAAEEPATPPAAMASEPPPAPPSSAAAAPVAPAPATPPPAVAAAPAVAPALPPVAPGVHLSMGARPAALAPEPPARAEKAPPHARIPEIAPLIVPATPKAREAYLPGPGDARPVTGAKKTPPAAAARRGLCTEILQRATLGELTEEDRAILRTQCR